MILKFSLFMTLFLTSFCMAQDNFTVIAHRGASGYLPEHTLESASFAHALNVDYIEPDVVMTKDDKLIVLHDVTLDSTTNVKDVFPKRHRKDGKFYAIDFTLAEIKSLKVGASKNKLGEVKYPQRFPQGKELFQIPTLEEMIILVQGLNQARKKNIGLYVEIKNPELHAQENKNIIDATMAMLRKYGYENDQKAIIQCFYPPALQEIKNKYKTKIPLVLLMAENSWKETSADYDYLMRKEGIKQVATYAKGIGFWMNGLFTQNKKKYLSMIDFAKKNGLILHGYTHRIDQFPQSSGFKDDRELFQYFKNTLKLDGVFSDFPDVILGYLKSEKAKKKLP